TSPTSYSSSETGLWLRGPVWPGLIRSFRGRRRPPHQRFRQRAFLRLILLKIMIHRELPEKDHGELLGLLAKGLEPRHERIRAILGRADRARQRLHVLDRTRPVADPARGVGDADLGGTEQEQMHAKHDMGIAQGA